MLKPPFWLRCAAQSCSSHKACRGGLNPLICWPLKLHVQDLHPYVHLSIYLPRLLRSSCRYLTRRSFNLSLKLLVIITSSSACTPALLPGYNESEARTLYWTSPGHANALAACSYNRMRVDLAAFKVVTVDLPCDVKVRSCLATTLLLMCQASLRP